VTGPAQEIIDAQQRELDRLRENTRLAADNVGDWRDLHQKWQVDFLRAERFEQALKDIAALDYRGNQPNEQRIAQAALDEVAAL